MLLQEFFDRVYYPRRLRGKSENSVRLYKLCITQFAKTIGRTPKLSDLNEENVLQHLARRSDVAPATRNKELAELTAMWRLASQRNLIDGWPDIQPEHEPQRDPIAFLREEIEKLFTSISREPGSVGDIPAWMWWNGFVRVMLDCGERVSAVRQIRWTWIQDSWLMIPAEARKGKTRDRRYQVSIATRQAIELIRLNGADPELLFPWPYCETYLWEKYRRILQNAGLPDTRKYKFHALRKTLGSVVYAAGMDPQDALDHSDRRTTQAYLDPRFQRKSQPCDALADYLRNPPRLDQSRRDVG